jgi:niacin transporter
LIIVLRAFSHLIFIALGAFILKKKGDLLNSFKTITLFSLAVSLIHAAAEVVVVTYFYFGNQVSEAFYKNGYVMSVLLLVGVGGLIHSMVDFSIAAFVWKPIQNVVSIPVSAKIRVRAKTYPNQ